MLTQALANVEPNEEGTIIDRAPRVTSTVSASTVESETETTNKPPDAQQANIVRLMVSETEFHLYSRPALSRGIKVYFLAFLTCVMISISVFYVYNAPIGPSPLTRLLFPSSDWTITVAIALIQVSVWLLFSLMNSACDEFRWSMACSTNGIHCMGFLSLSPSISFMTLLSVVICRNRPWFKSGRYWALQR